MSEPEDQHTTTNNPANTGEPLIHDLNAEPDPDAPAGRDALAFYGMLFDYGRRNGMASCYHFDDRDRRSWPPNRGCDRCCVDSD